MTSTTQVSENGVILSLQANHSNPSKCKTFYNPVMTICREFVLSCLGAYCGGKASLFTDKNMNLKCLEAFGATGVSGIQWKTHFPSDVDVTISDVEQEAVSSICANCERNGFSVLLGGPCDPRRTSNDPDKEGHCVLNTANKRTCLQSDEEKIKKKDGDSLSAMAVSHRDAEDDEVKDDSSLTVEISHGRGTGDSQSTIEVIHGDANVLMHSRQFHFIHIDPFGTTVQFLDAAFRNVYHKGIVVLTSTDVATLYGKCPQVSQRNYGAHTTRTGYMKELATRVVIATAARAAARCNKGIEVLYSVGVEHFIQVALRVKRGATAADASLAHVHRVLHCQRCGEWAVRADSSVVRADPYSLLCCQCHQEKGGEMAVELGPAWCGNIVVKDFVQGMLQAAERLKLSSRLQQLLVTLAEEAECPAKAATAEAGDTSRPEVQESAAGSAPKETTAPSHSDTREASEGRGAKRAQDGADDESDHSIGAKRKRNVRNYGKDDMPLFYYHLHHVKASCVNVPKIPKMVMSMRREGFRASRTHFDPHCVRTDASQEELRQVLQKYYKQKS